VEQSLDDDNGDVRTC